MSYILNALRKSEQERRNKELETLQHRIAEIQSPAIPRSSKLIPVLVVVNVVLLGYFIWDHYRQVPAAMAPDRSFAQAEKAIKVMNPVKGADKQAAAEPAPSQQLLQKLENEPQHKPLPIVKSKKEPPKAQPVAAVKKTPQQVLTKSEPVTEAASGDIQLARNLPSTVVALARQPAVEHARDVSPGNKPGIDKATNPIPDVTELPYEVRRRLPSFDINVFVYSKLAADSFVMIDMEKYKVGQRIHGLLELKEIRPDSLVVRYEDQIFQIKRP